MSQSPAPASRIRKTSRAAMLQLDLGLDFSSRANTPKQGNPAIRRKWRHIDTRTPLNVETERELVAAYQAGDNEAGGVLIMVHQGLVKSMATRHTQYGCPLEDLVAEANMGMCEAMKKFDPSHRKEVSNLVPMRPRRMRRHFGSRAPAILARALW